MSLRKKLSRRFTRQPQAAVPALPLSHTTTSTLPSLALPSLRPGSPLLDSPFLISHPNPRPDRPHQHRRSQSFSAIDYTPPIRPFASGTSEQKDTDIAPQPWRDRETWKALHSPPPPPAALEVPDADVGLDDCPNHPGRFPIGSGGWRRRKSDAVLAFGSATRSSSCANLYDAAAAAARLRSPSSPQRQGATESMSREAQKAWDALFSPRPTPEPLGGGVPITPSPLRLGTSSLENNSTPVHYGTQRPAMLRSPLSIPTPKSRSPGGYTSRFLYDERQLDRGTPPLHNYIPSSPTFPPPRTSSESAVHTRPSTLRPQTPLDFSSINISCTSHPEDDSQLLPPLLPSAIPRTAYRSTSFTSLHSNKSSGPPESPPIPWGVREVSDRGRTVSLSPTPWAHSATMPLNSPSKLSPRSSYSASTLIQVDFATSRNPSTLQPFEPAQEQDENDEQKREQPSTVRMYPTLQIGPEVMMKDDGASSPTCERVTTPETPLRMRYTTPTARTGIDCPSPQTEEHSQPVEAAMVDGSQEPWEVPKEHAKKDVWMPVVPAGENGRLRRGGFI